MQTSPIRVLSVIPPMTQLNTPYPSTAYLTGFLRSRGVDAVQDPTFDAEKAQWDRIKASTLPQDFVDFLLRFPNGRIAELAQFMLDQLARPRIAPGALPGSAAVLPSGAPRFRIGDAWEIETTDLLTGPKQRNRHRGTAIEGDRVIIDRGEVVVTQMGATLVNRYGVKDPGVLFEPADLQIGKRWRSATRCG